MTTPIARIWEHIDFTGRYLDITTSYYDLAAIPMDHTNTQFWNDKVSSIEVSMHSFVATLFKNSNYSGDGWSFMWKMNGARWMDEPAETAGDSLQSSSSDRL